jgi:hypothetical protein
LAFKGLLDPYKSPQAVPSPSPKKYFTAETLTTNSQFQRPLKLGLYRISKGPSKSLLNPCEIPVKSLPIQQYRAQTHYETFGTKFRFILAPQNHLGPSKGNRNTLNSL